MFPMKVAIWMFPEMRVLQIGWFTRENPTQMDGLEVALFQETYNILMSRMEAWGGSVCSTEMFKEVYGMFLDSLDLNFHGQ